MPDDHQKPEAPAALPRIEGYRIEALLGRGATGAVYSAVQLAVDRPVALKILHPELAGNKRAVRRLQREARTAARLGHPAIISAIDMGETQGRWWYAMELVEGISLAERIDEKGVLSEREALRVFAPLVDALQHAHEQGVVHRDVKPANILIDERGRARLVDLGLAFAEDDPKLTKPGGTLGTPHYISPEQARDPSDADTRSDIWSLGATLYHALCGRPPFNGASVAEILSAVLYDAVPDPRPFAPGMSKGMALVLRKCLSRDPTRRYQEPAALTRDLERLRERRNPEVNKRALEPVASDGPEWLRASLWTAALVVAAAGAVVVWSRPWRTERAAQEEQAPPARFAPFERLELRYGGVDGDERPSHRQTLTQVDRWITDGVVPAGLAVQVELFRQRVLDDLDSALDGVHRDVQAEFDGALDTGGVRDLRRIVDVELPRLLEGATGFVSLEELPAELDVSSELVLWRGALDERVDKARVAAFNGAHEALARHVDKVVVPAVRARLEQRAFVSALALLDEGPARWVAAAGVDEVTLLPDDVTRLLGSQRVLGEVNSRRWEVRNAWTALDQELEAFVGDREEQILADMREAHGVGTDAQQVLQFAWDGKLSSLNLALTEVPDAQYGFTARDELAGASARLGEAQRSAQETSARAALVADRELADELCRARRYGEALASWDAQLDLRWRASVRSDMLRERLIAARLEALLACAADGVRALRGEQAQFRVDGLPLEGRVTAVTTPRDGFTLVLPTGPPRTLYLVAPAPGAKGVVDTRALEVLAGLGDVQSLSTSQRLDLALLRYYEGDYQGAREVLPVVQLAGDEGGVQLDLTLRIAETRQRVSAAAKERREALATRVGRFYRDFKDTGATKSGLLQQIAFILEEFDDILEDDVRTDLIAKREGLLQEPQPLTLEEAFPGARIERGARPRDVAVTWDFEVDAGAWTEGDWRVAGGSLALLGGVRTQDRYFDERYSPHVTLAPLLSVEEELRVVLTFEYAVEEAPLNEIVFSVSGFHFVFVDRPGEPRWIAGPGDVVAAERLLEDLRAGEDSSFRGFEGFGMTTSNTIEVSLRPVSKRVNWIEVNGEKLTLPGTYVDWVDIDPTVRLRSFEPMRLLEVRLEGKTAKR